MCRRLSMSAEPDGLFGRGRRILENGGGVMCERGVVHEARQIRTVIRQRLQYAVVHGTDTLRRNDAVHGETRQFMTETDGFGLTHEQTARSGFVHCRLMRSKNGFN